MRVDSATIYIFEIADIILEDCKIYKRGVASKETI